VNAGHCGASVSKLHNGLEMLLSLSKFKIDVANTICCQHHMTGKQRVATYCCVQPAPSLFVLQATKGGRGGLGTRLNVIRMYFILHAQIIYSLVSYDMSVIFHTLRPYDVISGQVTSLLV